MKWSNEEVAKLFEQMAAACEILGENRFVTLAYQRAAETIAHLTQEIQDLWEDGKLSGISGLGKAMVSHLDELFRTGGVKHFKQVMGKVPAGVFPLLLIPGIGPRKAYKLVSLLKIKSHGERAIVDLKSAAVKHLIARLPTFGEKSEADILFGITAYEKGHIKERRLPLWQADPIANRLLANLRKHPAAMEVEVLGSLRRRVSTVGDIDIAVATNDPEVMIKHFLKIPHEKLIEQGSTGVSVILTGGKQVDLRVVDPESFGSMLQYFTGSKNHNIKLRSLALARGLSLNEYGITNVKTKKLTKYDSEEKFYQAIGLPWIAPEMREDRGEIEYARRYRKMPELVNSTDIKGDLHLHTSYNLQPSHDLGTDTAVEYLKKAESLGYEYVGFSDHNPSVSKHSANQVISIMKRRKDEYEKQYYSYNKSVHNHKSELAQLRQGYAGRVKYFLMCEVDIDPKGQLALPEAAFDYVDAVIVSVHSSFNLDRTTQTARVIAGLTAHPKVRIFGHPTARLINERSSIDLDWTQVFVVAKKYDIALEINSAPERLDLPDPLVQEAVKAGVKLVINTDAHQVAGMEALTYGVSVARRGWAQEKDILNTKVYNEFKNWLVKI